MPQRDYATRPQKKKGSSLNKLLLILIVLAILTSFGLALLFLKYDSPPAQQPNTQATALQSKTALPSKPEETQSYIRDLETREIPTDGSKKYQLNDKQKKILDDEQKKILEEFKKDEPKEEPQYPAEQQAVAQTTTDTKTQAQTTETQGSIEPTPEQLAAQQKAEKDKKTKLAEDKKSQTEQHKKQQKQQEPLSPAKKETTQKTTEAPQQKTVQTVSRFGLHCGTFKNKDNAANVQARLAMAGFNARINSNADWNRVIVGPIGDRPSAVAAQTNAKSVAECYVIAM